MILDQQDSATARTVALNVGLATTVIKYGRTTVRLPGSPAGVRITPRGQVTEYTLGEDRYPETVAAGLARHAAATVAALTPRPETRRPRGPRRKTKSLGL